MNSDSLGVATVCCDGIKMVLFFLTNNVLSIRKSEILLRNDGFTSKALSVWSRIYAWKALEKSKKRTRAEAWVYPCVSEDGEQV